MKQHAVRNLRLCTKDCLCLYVCPTGAADTENSVIDVNKCIGCGACAAACPSKAISMMPNLLPPQQKKDKNVVNKSFDLTRNKAKEEKIAKSIAANTDNSNVKRLAIALKKSNRLVAEDLMREAGYMLPQSSNAQELLRGLISNPPAGFPVEAAKKILTIIKENDKKEENKGGEGKMANKYA